MCARCAQGVRKMCARCAQGVRKVCARCVQGVGKVCSICVQDVCKLCAKKPGFKRVLKYPLNVCRSQHAHDDKPFPRLSSRSSTTFALFFSLDHRQLIWKAGRAKFFFPLSCVCKTLAILAIEDLVDWISVSRNRGGLSWNVSPLLLFLVAPWNCFVACVLWKLWPF